MTKRLSLLLAAAVIAIFGVYQFVPSSNADGDQEVEREKCVEECG